MVASTSAFISTTGFSCWKDSRMMRAPNSTEPVTSTTTSISGERQMVNGSSATTGAPRRIASSIADCVSAETTCSWPA